MCSMFLGFSTLSRMWNLIIYWSLIYSGLYNFWFTSCLLCRTPSVNFLSIWILKLLDLRSSYLFLPKCFLHISPQWENSRIQMWTIKILCDYHLSWFWVCTLRVNIISIIYIWTSDEKDWSNLKSQLKAHYPHWCLSWLTSWSHSWSLPFLP